MDNITHSLTGLALGRAGLSRQTRGAGLALVLASNAVKLLGAAVVLTGIRPEVARTLVSMNIDLGSIVNHGTLRAGIGHALRRNLQYGGCRKKWIDVEKSDDQSVSAMRQAIDASGCCV